MITTHELAMNLFVKKYFYGRTPPLIGEESIEHDKRSRAKAVRALVGSGLVRDHDDESVEILPKVFDEFPAQVVTDQELLAVWNKRRDGTHGTQAERNLPYVVLGDYRVFDGITLNQALGLVADPTVQWFTCSSFQGSLYRVEQDLRGPFTVAQVPESLRSYSRSSGGEVVAVSRATFQELVKTTLFDEQVERAIPKHLEWGLMKAGILTEEEAKLVKCGVSDLMLNIRGLHFKEDPANWGTQLESALDGLLEDLAEVQRKIAVAIKIQRGIAKMGGWDTFLAFYREAVIQAFREEDEKKEQTDTAKAD